MKAPIIDTAGKKIGDKTLPKTVFGVEVNPNLLAQYVRVYQHRQRQNTNIVQNRAVVTGTTAKVWRQKGTGRARHGSRKAPIFVAGGKAHAPTGGQTYKLNLSKKMKRKALLAALTNQVEKVTVLQDVSKLGPKTKDLSDFVAKLADKKGILFVLDAPHKDFLQASKNLQNIKVTQAKRLNAYEVLLAKHLVITEKSLDLLQEVFAGKDKGVAS